MTATHREQAQFFLAGMNVTRPEHVIALAQVHATLALSDPKPLPVVEFRRPHDERIDLYVNGKQVASANHDEHGWAGVDAFEQMAMVLVKAFGGEIAEAEVGAEDEGGAR